jgi:hypothetical protein
MNRRSSSGFTLLEALIAIVMIAIAIVPLYEFVGRSLASLAKVSEINLESEARLTALSVLNGVNPMTDAGNAVTAGAYRIHWSADLLDGPIDAIRHPSGIGSYVVGLYRMRVEVSRQSGPWFTFDTIKVGYRQERPPSVFSAPPTR